MSTLNKRDEHAAIDRAVVMHLQRLEDYAVILLDGTYETRLDADQLYFHYIGNYMLAKQNMPVQQIEARGTLQRKDGQWTGVWIKCQIDHQGGWHETRFATDLAVPGAMFWFCHKQLVSVR